MNGSDAELLAEFARTRSDRAFGELLRRHLSLVYSSALRQVRSPDLAKDVSQSVFLDLAKNAARLRPNTNLATWLYSVTRRTAIDVIRSETRRLERQRIAMETLSPSPENAWAEIEPLLDEAMESLPEVDRTALLLRYLQDQPLRDVGRALGTSDDAAQKRVSRALAQLRLFFEARGVQISSGAIATALAQNAIATVPVSLSATVLAHVAAVPAATVAAVGTAAHAFLMTTTQKALIGLLATASLGVSVYQANRLAENNEAIANMRDQNRSLAAQLQAAEVNAATMQRRADLLAQEVAQLQSNPAELMRLRAEVTQLRREASANVPADDFAETAREWKRKELRLRQIFADSPHLAVPEMSLLDERVWLDVARDFNLDTEQGVREATARLRFIAKNTFANALHDALMSYTMRNDQRLPQQLAELKEHFPPESSKFHIKVTDDMLAQYELRYTGKASDVPKGEWVIAEKQAVDDEHDRRWLISPNGFTNQSFKRNEPTVAEQILSNFVQANGRYPKEPSDLLPFVQTDAEKAAFKETLENAQFRFPDTKPER